MQHRSGGRTPFRNQIRTKSGYLSAHFTDDPLSQPSVQRVWNRRCSRITSYYPSMSSSTTALVSDEPAASPETQCSHLGHSSRTSHCVHVVTGGLLFFFFFFWSRGWKRWGPGERRGHEGKQKEKRSVGMWHDNGFVVAVSVWEVSPSTHFVLLSVISSLIWTLPWITNPGCLFPSLPWSSFSSSSSSSSPPLLPLLPLLLRPRPEGPRWAQSSKSSGLPMSVISVWIFVFLFFFFFFFFFYMWLLFHFMQQFVCECLSECCWDSSDNTSPETTSIFHPLEDSQFWCQHFSTCIAVFLYFLLFILDVFTFIFTAQIHVFNIFVFNVSYFFLSALVTVFISPICPSFCLFHGFSILMALFAF